MTIALDKGQWRLRFGSTPVKLVARGGTFGLEDASAWETYIIRAEDLETYVTLAFPTSVLINNMAIPQRCKAFPGFPQLALRKLTWKAHVEGLPVDPFNSDPTAPDNTYQEDIQIDLEYGTTPYNSGSPTSGTSQDASTFLEISAVGTGEFINSPIRGTSQWSQLAASEDPEVREGNVPLPVPQPMIEWSAKWNQIPADWFRSTYITKLKDRLGTVNETPFKLFQNAPADTILFVGWSAQTTFTWRDGFAGASPMRMEFKFVEKNFKSVESVDVTHQHLYRPGYGFRTLTINNGPLYLRTDLNRLFEP